MDYVHLKLSGKVGGLTRTTFMTTCVSAERANDYLPRCGRRRVGWLMEQIRPWRATGTARRDSGLNALWVVPHISYLASSLRASSDVTNSPTSRRSGLGSLMSRPSKEAEAKVTTGEVAVQASKRAREQQDTLTVANDKPSSAVRQAGGKTFYLRDGVWTDSEFKPDSRLPEKVLRFGSDEYFALLKEKPGLSAFFSLGERVVVVFEGRVYRVNEASP